LVFWRRVRFFEIIRKPIRCVFVADVELRLNGTLLANEFTRHVAIFEGEGRLVLRKIGVGLRAARFEERDPEASFRKTLAGPAAGSSGADDDDVEFFTR